MDGRLAALSQWIDDSQGDRDPEAILWGRVSKITEEAGEAIAALIGLTGQNPRKGVTHTMGDLQDELLDVAVTALCAVEHINANDGRSMLLLAEKVQRIASRAGLLAAVGAQQKVLDSLRVEGPRMVRCNEPDCPDYEPPEDDKCPNCGGPMVRTCNDIECPPFTVRAALASLGEGE